MALLPYSYSIAVGSSVALGSLINMEDLIYQYTKPRRITVRSQVVNLYPVRTVTGSGRERGDGTINHAWEFTGINQTAVNYLYSYLWSGSVVSTAVTINTRLHQSASYARFNAFAVRPLPGQDVEYLRAGVFRMVIRFSNLEAL